MPEHAPTPSLDDLLLFTPVAMERRRLSGWTAEVQRAFIARLARCGVVAVAARSVGRTARSAYRLRLRLDAGGFSRAWDYALDIGRDAALAEAVDHAQGHRFEDVWHRGRRVGVRFARDHRVLLGALGAMRAEAQATPPHRERLIARAEIEEEEARLGPVSWPEGEDPGPPVWPANDIRPHFPVAMAQGRKRRAEAALRAKIEAEVYAELYRGIVRPIVVTPDERAAMRPQPRVRSL